MATTATTFLELFRTANPFGAGPTVDALQQRELNDSRSNQNPPSNSSLMDKSLLKFQGCPTMGALAFIHVEGNIPSLHLIFGLSAFPNLPLDQSKLLVGRNEVWLPQRSVQR